MGSGEGQRIDSCEPGTSADWEPTRGISVAIFSRVYCYGRWVGSRPHKQATSVVTSPLEVVREEGSDMGRTVFGITTRHAIGASHFEIRVMIIRRLPSSRLKSLELAVDEDDKTSDSVQKGNDRLVISEYPSPPPIRICRSPSLIVPAELRWELQTLEFFAKAGIVR